MKKKVVVIVGILLALSASLAVAALIIAPSFGYQIRITGIYSNENTSSFNYVEDGDSACMAIMMECGVCYLDGKNGIVVNKTCYLPV
jgi:ABC-type uncharacterized transport system permease subunit